MSLNLMCNMTTSWKFSASFFDPIQGARCCYQGMFLFAICSNDNFLPFDMQNDTLLTKMFYPTPLKSQRFVLGIICKFILIYSSYSSIWYVKRLISEKSFSDPVTIQGLSVNASIRLHVDILFILLNLMCNMATIWRMSFWPLAPHKGSMMFVRACFIFSSYSTLRFDMQLSENVNIWIYVTTPLPQGVRGCCKGLFLVSCVSILFIPIWYTTWQLSEKVDFIMCVCVCVCVCVGGRGVLIRRVSPNLSLNVPHEEYNSIHGEKQTKKMWNIKTNLMHD